MNRMMCLVGSLAGWLGALLCVAAVVARAMTKQPLFGHELATYLQLGIAMMVFGCFAKLEGASCKRAVKE